MATEPEQAAAKTADPVPQSSKRVCPIPKEKREEFAKMMKESKEESFWYRALPLSIGSMIATQGLIYKGYLSKSKRLGSLPKVALAGLLGYIVGKVSYMGTYQKKFENLGMQNMFNGGFGPCHCHKKCQHPCEECKKKCTKEKQESSEPSPAS